MAQKIPGQPRFFPVSERLGIKRFRNLCTFLLYGARNGMQTKGVSLLAEKWREKVYISPNVGRRRLARVNTDRWKGGAYQKNIR